jgi:hypothetical protein
MNTLVPTQRLWNRINESIEVQKANQPIWKSVYAFIAASFASPSMTAAAGVLIVFGFLAVMWTLRPSDPTVTLVSPPPVPGSPLVGPVEKQSNENELIQRSQDSATYVSRSDKSDKELENLVREANKRNEIRATPAVYYGPLPGEQSYLKTITDLKETVDVRKDAVFTPSGRVAFERDLAVVNDAIKRTQKVVRSNPRNQGARQGLYSAYQDKIDLLNTVAQRDELIASTR